MKVREIDYDHEQLNVFSPNDAYRKCHRELVEDFEVAYAHFLDQDLPDNLTEAQIASAKNQKTHYLSAFVSGCLNTLNPNSQFFNKMEMLTGNKEVKEKDSPLSGLILPDHYRK